MENFKSETQQGTTTNTVSPIDLWNTPKRVEVNEYPDRIEMIYKQTSMISFKSPEERAFKIVYSCVDGKWNKSEPIFGKVIPAQDEYYEFED